RPRETRHLRAFLRIGRSRAALDRLLARAGRRADLDPARLRLLGLAHVDLQHAVSVVGLDAVLGRALRQPDRARERAEAALEAVEPLAVHLVRALALAADRERAVLELDRDLVLGDAGQVERVDDLV